MDDHPTSVLLTAFLAKRDDLKRLFTLRLGSPDAADDLVQEIYLKILTNPAGEIRTPAAYLYRLGSNLMLDRLKQQRRAAARDDAWRRTHVAAVGAEDVADEPSAEDVTAARQRLERIVEALNDLPERARRAFMLLKFDGLSHAETAAALGVSRSAVEKYLSAALKHLVAKVG